MSHGRPTAGNSGAKSGEFKWQSWGLNRSEERTPPSLLIPTDSHRLILIVWMEMGRFQSPWCKISVVCATSRLFKSYLQGLGVPSGNEEQIPQHRRWVHACLVFDFPTSGADPRLIL